MHCRKKNALLELKENLQKFMPSNVWNDTMVVLCHAPISLSQKVFYSCSWLLNFDLSGTQLKTTTPQFLTSPCFIPKSLAPSESTQLPLLACCILTAISTNFAKIAFNSPICSLVDLLGAGLLMNSAGWLGIRLTKRGRERRI